MVRRSRQYAFISATAWAPVSFSCRTATSAFAYPLGVKPTAILVIPSAQSARNDFGAVAVRTRILMPGSHRSRSDSSKYSVNPSRGAAGLVGVGGWWLSVRRG